MDRKNNHTANKNKQSKYGKLYFIEHSSEYYQFESFTWIPIQILYIHGHFKLRNMKLHVLTIKLTHWAWAACACIIVGLKTHISVWILLPGYLNYFWLHKRWILRDFRCMCQMKASLINIRLTSRYSAGSYAFAVKGLYALFSAFKIRSGTQFDGCTDLYTLCGDKSLTYLPLPQIVCL